jgi:hypothetical protein
MVRKNNASAKNPYVYYICSGFKSKSSCTSHSIRDNQLEGAVLSTIQRHIASILDMEQTLSTMEHIQYTSRQVKKATERLEVKRLEQTKYQNHKIHLYEDYADGIVTREDYLAFGKRFDRKIAEAQDNITAIEKEIEELAAGKTEGQEWIRYFRQYQNIKELTRKLVLHLIDRITVHEDKKIHIQFKFQQEYDQLFACLQGTNPMSADAPSGLEVC